MVSGLEEKGREQASNSRINFVISSGQILFSNEGSSEPFLPRISESTINSLENHGNWASTAKTITRGKGKVLIGRHLPFLINTGKAS